MKKEKRATNHQSFPLQTGRDRASNSNIMNQKNAALWALLFVLGCIASAWFFIVEPKLQKKIHDAKSKAAQQTPATNEQKDLAPDPKKSLPPELYEETYETLGEGITVRQPSELLEKLAMEFQKGAFNEVTKIIGKDALSENDYNELRKLMEQTDFKLANIPFQEIGESELNKNSRFAINLSSDANGRIYLDLERNTKGWSVRRITLPNDQQGPEFAGMEDSLGTADTFLQNALNQRFEEALKSVDTTKVSDAKVAGLCILFEEGKYKLRPQKPLRAAFNKENHAGFLATVETNTGENAAEFGINLQRDPAKNGKWKVTDIALDQLLLDYAQRIERGDIYYSPLAKNPKGGDTLVIYFEFDNNELTPRMQRQLDIIALLLKADQKREITLTGHADALGTDNYNSELSTERANAVKSYLSSKGVPTTQVKTEAAGESLPRRPNAREDGSDDPEGRRANRRTEIYLNF